jgi:hypothetical protein
VGEAQRREPGCDVRLIARPVAGLLGRRAVVAQPVRLDHEPQFGQKKSTLYPLTWTPVSGLERPAARAIGKKQRSS